MTARKDEEGTRSGSLFSCQKIVFFLRSVVRNVVKPPGSRKNKGDCLNNGLKTGGFTIVRQHPWRTEKSRFYAGLLILRLFTVVLLQLSKCGAFLVKCGQKCGQKSGQLRRLPGDSRKIMWSKTVPCRRDPAGDYLRPGVTRL